MTQRTFARANLLRTCYGETGIMHFGLKLTSQQCGRHFYGHHCHCLWPHFLWPSLAIVEPRQLTNSSKSVQFRGNVQCWSQNWNTAARDQKPWWHPDEELQCVQLSVRWPPRRHIGLKRTLRLLDKQCTIMVNWQSEKSHSQYAAAILSKRPNFLYTVGHKKRHIISDHNSHNSWWIFTLLVSTVRGVNALQNLQLYPNCLYKTC